MSSPKSFPDIEIYLKRVSLEDIVSWLESLFPQVEVQRTEPNTRCKITTSSGSSMFCTLSDQAAKGGYASVWFESNETKWKTDRECAHEAFHHFKAETRCSTGGWEGEDDGGWLRFTDKGEQVVNWHT